MRDVIDPWTAAPDVVLALQRSRIQRFGAPGLEDGAERLRRRDQVVHSLEVSRRRRRRRGALRPA